MSRLVLLLGDFSAQDADIRSTLEEWTSAGILDGVAWCDVGGPLDDSPTVSVVEGQATTALPLYELLTSRVWSVVTVLAVRQRPPAENDPSRFDREIEILLKVTEAFEQARNVNLTSATLSFAETSGLNTSAFSSEWKFHVLQEPVMRIDDSVAAQPLRDESRGLLLTMTAMVATGGFVWQDSSLLVGQEDRPRGNWRPIRVGRAYLRVVSAGRLTDDVLRGAFPASGPWSVPPDLAGARGVPPGTQISEQLVRDTCDAGGFVYRPFPPRRTEPETKRMPIWQGLQLYAIEFVSSIREIAVEGVSKVRREIEDWFRDLTFGPESRIIFRSNVDAADFDLSETLDVLKARGLGEIDPISDPAPWRVLQRVALGVVDGGPFPDAVRPPMSGVSRLIFTDPRIVGPSPGDLSFEFSLFERSLLQLEDESSGVEPMDVGTVHLVNQRFSKVSEEFRAEDGPASESSEDGSTESGFISGLRDRWRRRTRRRSSRRAERRARRREKRAATVHTETAAVATTLDAAGSESEGSTDEVTATTDGTPASEDTTPIDTTRHRPTHPDFDAAEYAPLTSFYQGQDPAIAREYEGTRSIYDGAVSSFPTAPGIWSLSRGCDHCGTNFDHGVLFVHEPTQSLVHVGHICARKVWPLRGETDFVQERFVALERRWRAWLSERSGSILWRVADSVIVGIEVAWERFRASIDEVNVATQSRSANSKAPPRLKRLVKRGLFLLGLLLTSGIVAVILTPISILLMTSLVVLYVFGYTMTFVRAARDRVRERHRRKGEDERLKHAHDEARHAAQEIVRLGSVYEQFDDWQVILRTIAHLPFGQGLGEKEHGIGMSDVSRPPSMILATAEPDRNQKMQLFLSARGQTIHAGWLTEVLELMRETWRLEYQQSRLIGSADNILPEADNAPAGSVVGKKPLSDEDVYYPRVDFRRHVETGRLQQALVEVKAGHVADDLKQRSIEDLLSDVTVQGPGAALSGQPVRDFLAGLSVERHEKVPFPPDLIGILHPSEREFYPVLALPPFGTLNSVVGQVQVDAGVELTAASWRLELSDAIHPLEKLAGFDSPPPEGDE